MNKGASLVDSLRGLQFASLRVDTLISMSFGEDRSYRLDVEVPFEITEPRTGISFQIALRPSGGPSTGLSLLADLVNELVVSASASKDGTITLEFADSRVMRVRPIDKFEAWSLWAPGGLFTGAAPGGGLM